VRGALSELDQVNRMLREVRIARKAELCGAMRKLRPTLAGGAVVRRRVDEEGCVNGRW